MFSCRHRPWLGRQHRALPKKPETMAGGKALRRAEARQAGRTPGLPVPPRKRNRREPTLTEATEPVAKHPATLNPRTAQPAAEPQALGPVFFGAKGAVAECGRERRGQASNEAAKPVCRSLRRQSGGPESWHGVARRGACRVACKRRDGRTECVLQIDKRPCTLRCRALNQRPRSVCHHRPGSATRR